MLYDAPFNAFSTRRSSERAVIAPVSFEVYDIPELSDFDLFRELASWLITVIYGIEYRLDERIILVASVMPIEENSEDGAIRISITCSLVDVNEVYFGVVLFTIYSMLRRCMEVEVFRGEIARSFVIESDLEFNVLSLAFILEVYPFRWIILVKIPA